MRAAFEGDKKIHVFWKEVDGRSFHFRRVPRGRRKRMQKYRAPRPPPLPDFLPKYVVQKSDKRLETSSDLTTAQIIDFGCGW